MISLMQKDVRGEKGKGGGGLTAERDQAVAVTTGQGGNTFTIGFHFMKVGTICVHLGCFCFFLSYDIITSVRSS